jgi:hypothetical protein
MTPAIVQHRRPISWDHSQLRRASFQGPQGWRISRSQPGTCSLEWYLLPLPAEPLPSQIHGCGSGCSGRKHHATVARVPRAGCFPSSSPQIDRTSSFSTSRWLARAEGKHQRVGIGSSHTARVSTREHPRLTLKCRPLCPHTNAVSDDLQGPSRARY